MCLCNRKWEKNAFGVLDELHHISRDKSHALLIGKLQTWKGTTVFDLAVDADSVDFKSHDSFQDKLDSIWFGKALKRTTFGRVGINVARIRSCRLLNHGCSN